MKELLRILGDTFASRDWEEWREILLANRITVSPVNRIEDVITDSQVLANQMLADLDLPDGRRIKTVSSPIGMQGMQKVAPKPAPGVGEHTEEILGSIGYSAADIAELRAKNII